MNVKDYLAKVAHIAFMDFETGGGTLCKVYQSNYDNSYMAHVGREDTIKYLADHEITDFLTHGVGFSPKDGKWYGWSHRAIYGFEIGSTCKKGDCHYRPTCLADEIKKAIEFWSDPDHLNVKAKADGPGVIKVTWRYNNKIPNRALRRTISGVTWHYDPNNYGRGEWTAKTLEDAKQMAIDFNEGVS